MSSKKSSNNEQSENCKDTNKASVNQVEDVKDISQGESKSKLKDNVLKLREHRATESLK